MPKIKQIDGDVKEVLRILRGFYLPLHPKAEIQAYRFNPASIRVRVIDPSFARVGLTERDDEIWGVLKENLSEDILSQLSLLLLLAPQERDKSMMNEEFEHPMPSRL